MGDFFGLQILPHKSFTASLTHSFRVSMAALSPDSPSKKRSSLRVKTGANANWLICCTLIPDKIPQQPLDLSFYTGDEVSFEVDGDAEIHLTGNYIADEGEFVDGDEEDEDEDEELDEEDIEDEHGFPIAWNILGEDMIDEEEDDSDEESVEDDEEDGEPKIKEITSDEELQAINASLDRKRKAKELDQDDSEEGEENEDEDEDEEEEEDEDEDEDEDDEGDDDEDEEDGVPEDDASLRHELTPSQMRNMIDTMLESGDPRLIKKGKEALMYLNLEQTDADPEEVLWGEEDEDVDEDEEGDMYMLEVAEEDEEDEESDDISSKPMKAAKSQPNGTAMNDKKRKHKHTHKKHKKIHKILVVFPILFVLDAPYGKFTNRRKFFFTINGKWGWCLMEIVSPITFLAFTLPVYLHPTAQYPWTRLQSILTGMWLMHYVHRSLIFPWRNPTMKPMDAIMAMCTSVAFNLLNGYVNGAWIARFGGARLAEASAHPLRFATGLALFVIGMVTNIYHDNHMIQLRKAPKPKGQKHNYSIPTAGLFRYISCPAYLGETIEWTGFALAAYTSPAAWCFTISTAANLWPRAFRTHQWYHDTFGKEYPKNRKAIVPFLF
ncbi:hypothetical protein BZG36_03045 [Bifiguratus adelaidae]|uniref:Uncharacterized protein n=1 Tax=Bifiguratus adelaidae TaxID=1938954 RepID=A0A261XYX8_9FUNG|nr:hypothetical protein BZG36_03045 [Bifiguratus adelaidae]